MGDKTIHRINVATLAVGILGLVGVLGEGFFRLFKLGAYPLDTNWLVTFLIIFYTAATGLKFVLTGRRRNGYYLLFFSVILTVVAAILLKYGQ